MSSFLRQLGLVLLIASRSLVSHRSRTALVGSILALGTALVLVGVSLLSSIERSMKASITQSLAGDLQVYSNEGRDELALFGGGFMGQDDIGRIDRIEDAAPVVRAVPGVKAVVPMGIDFATITQAGELESALSDLRAAVYRTREGKARARELDAAARKVRELVGQVAGELRRRTEVASDPDAIRKVLAEVEQATTDAFWQRFREAPLEQLEFLDTRVAPRSVEGRIIYFRYLGTDVDAFAENFDRFQVVEGERIPTHTRGLMFNQKFYEREIKHEIARALDRIHRGLVEQELTIAGDALLGTLARRIPTQYRRVTYQLDREEAAALAEELRGLLGAEFAQSSIEEMMEAFLTVDDGNFEARYAWFYEHVAPRIDLYMVDVGDTVTIRTFTRSGFLKAINVEMTGVFRFAGLDGSDLAGSHNLMDLVTFRELYGLMTPAKARELDAIRKKVGVRDVDRDEAEDALFGTEDGAEDSGSLSFGDFDEFADVDLEGLQDRAQRVFDSTFTQADVDGGMALNLAVVLEDGARADRVGPAIRSAVSDAGLQLQVVSWQEAAGLIGQFVVVIRAVLYIALIVIFSVALVIINNSTVTATLERIPEIGTMRAIGAGRGLVLALVVLESLAVSLLAGSLGVAVGSAVLAVLGQTGIPAWHPVVVFLFGGPRLYPSFDGLQVVGAVAAVAVVSLVSAVYPARIAAAVQPIEAMQDRD